jgi:transcriptional regulator with XRE-family HTH domain
VNRIKELREQRSRLTQAELAKLLSVDETAVSRWENGTRPLTPVVIEKLSGIFKVSSWELFFDRRALRELGRPAADIKPIEEPIEETT